MSSLNKTKEGRKHEIVRNMTLFSGILIFIMVFAAMAKGRSEMAADMWAGSQWIASVLAFLFTIQSITGVQEEDATERSRTEVAMWGYLYAILLFLSFAPIGAFWSVAMIVVGSGVFAYWMRTRHIGKVFFPGEEWALLFLMPTVPLSFWILQSVSSWQGLAIPIALFAVAWLLSELIIQGAELRSYRSKESSTSDASAS